MTVLDLGALKIGVEVSNSNAYIELDKTAQKVDDTSKKIDESIKNLGESLSKTGSTLTKTITLPIVAAATACVKYASDMTETMGKTEVVFGDNTNAILDWSATSIEKMGLAEETALSAASTFGDLGSSMGILDEQNAKMSMSLVQLAADMASFKNISVERATTALNGIYTGETESLKAMGIVMTETNLKQYAMNQGITTAYEELTQAEKVMLRYNYVMEKTTNAQGDFVRTGSSTANQARKAKETLKQLATTLGQSLLPVVNRVLTAVNNFLNGLINMDDGTKQVIRTIASVAATVGPVLLLGGKVITMISSIKSALSTLNISLTSTTSVIGLVIAGLSILAGVMIANSITAAEKQEQAQERLNARLEESARKVGELNIHVEEGNTKLDEYSKTASDVAAPSTDTLKESIGKLFLGIGDLKQGIEDVNTGLGNYVDALAAARRATTIDHILYLTQAFKDGKMGPEEFNSKLNEVVATQKAYENSISTAKTSFDDFLKSFNGGAISMEESNKFLQGVVTSGLDLGVSLTSAAEGYSKLEEAQKNGTISGNGYNIVAQDTANLLQSDCLNAVTGISNAYDVYNQRVENALAKEQQQREDTQAYIESMQTKQSVLDMYVALVSSGVDKTDTLKRIEIAYGTETTSALKTAFEEKYGTMEVGYREALLLQEEYRLDIKTSEEALNEESGAIAEQRKNAIISAQQSMQSEISNITTGWTDEQIEAFAKLAKESGLELDEGFIEMLKACNTFQEESALAFNEAGELDAKAFSDGLNTIFSKLDEFSTDINGKGKEIGIDYSSGVAMGIKNGEFKAINAARDMIKRAIEAARKEGDGHSPFRKAAKKIGTPFAQGVEVGFQDYMPKALATVKKGINSLISGGMTVAKATSASVKSAVPAQIASTPAINQTINFTARELTPYEEMVRVRGLSKALAGGLR